MTFVNQSSNITWPDIICRIQIGIVNENKRPDIDRFNKYIELIDNLSQRNRIPFVIFIINYS